MPFTGTSRTLFAFCLNTGLSILHCLNYHFYHFRVDPTATSDVNQKTPLEIALECHQHLEVLHVLAKFMEMPINVKHTQLALLANNDKADDGSNEEFHKILNSLPLEMVGNAVKISSEF